MRKRVDILDASRMSAITSGETSKRVSEYFGDGGPFGYGFVRKLTPVLLSGNVPFDVATLGIVRIKFKLARDCNLDVARLVAECDRFRSCHFYPLNEIVYPIDQKFEISLKPETVAVVNSVPNLIFLQPRKHPTLWAYNAAFIRRVLEDSYIPAYFESARFWLLDTEALAGGVREMNLVDLQAVAPMSDREFARRVASLRAAWRLYLTAPRSKRPRRENNETGQTDFDFES